MIAYPTKYLKYINLPIISSLSFVTIAYGFRPVVSYVEACSEPSQISKMERFAKLLIILTKRSILDVWQGQTEYASVMCAVAIVPGQM